MLYLTLSMDCMQNIHVRYIFLCIYMYKTFRKLASFKDLLYIASVYAFFFFINFSLLSRNIYI